MELLRLRGIYKKGNKQNIVLQDINLQIRKGEKTGIVGETGSGKTTLLKVIAGLVQSNEGNLLFEGERILGAEEKLVPGHEAIIYISQHFELPKYVTVEAAVFDPFKTSVEEVSKLYAACRIEHLLDKDTRSLSGGEMQKVALAIALVKQPKLLLMDEPFSNLDLHHQQIIREVIQNVEQQLGTTIVIVSHDPLDLLSWADRIIVMKSGKIVQQGTPQDLYNNPVNEYVAGLFGPYNLIDSQKISLNGLNKLNGKVIVRPEAISLIKNSAVKLKGTIIGISFYGSYEMVQLKVDTEVLTAMAAVGEYKVGDEVGIKLGKPINN